MAKGLVAGLLAGGLAGGGAAVLVYRYFVPRLLAGIYLGLILPQVRHEIKQAVKCESEEELVEFMESDEWLESPGQAVRH